MDYAPTVHHSVCGSITTVRGQVRAQVLPAALLWQGPGCGLLTFSTDYKIRWRAFSSHLLLTWDFWHFFQYEESTVKKPCLLNITFFKWMHPNWWDGMDRMILFTPHTRAHPPCSLTHLHELLWCPGSRSHPCPSPISPTLEWDSPTCCSSQPSASLTLSSSQRVSQPSPGFLLCPVLLFQRLRRGGKERAQQSCESCLDDSKSRQTISQGNSLLLPWPDLWQLLMLVKTSTFSIRYLCDIHRASSASAVCQGLGCSRDPWQCTKGTKLSTARRKIYCASCPNLCWC